jgi:hypothetical protein
MAVMCQWRLVLEVKNVLKPLRMTGRKTLDTRARHHSQKDYNRSPIDPKKLGFYPPQWRDVLERAHKLWRPWMVLECGSPKRNIKAHLDKAMHCVTDALSEHQRNGGEVERGTYQSS